MKQRLKIFGAVVVIYLALMPVSLRVEAQEPWYQAGGVPASSVAGAYQAICGPADQAGSYINLANPGVNDLTVGNAPGWNSSNGWIFDGVNDLLDAGIVPDGSHSMLITYNKNSANNVNWGVLAGVDTFALSVNNSETRFRYGPISGTESQHYTVIGIGINNNNAYKYRDGWRGLITTQTTLNPQGDTLTIGAHNYNGGADPFSFFNGEIQAIVIYDEPLTDAQFQAVSAAMVDVCLPPATSTPTPIPTNTPTSTPTATLTPTSTPTGTVVAPTATPTATPTSTPLPGFENSIGILTQQTVNNSPFNIAPMPIPTANPTSVAALKFDWGVDELNYIGSFAVTILKFLDQYDIIYRLLLIMAALFILRWAFKFVTGASERPTRAINTHIDADSLDTDISDDESPFQDIYSADGEIYSYNARKTKAVRRLLKRR